MRFRYLLALALAGLTVAAYADTRAYEKQQLARFERYAGDPIKEFPMFSLWQWQVVGPTKLVVWPKINEAYLLTVDKGCNNLEWTHGLSLTQNMRQKVSQKFDYVVFGGQRCKIEQIRPIDYRTMVKEGKAEPPPEHKE